MPRVPSDLIAEARTRWERCASAEKAQREAILLAKKFRNLDQWPAAIKAAREGAGNVAGQPAQPPRPCLVVDRLSQPVRQVSNSIKNADFGFEVLPNGAGADVETAEILKGYLRRVQNQARGESPIEWAADQAIEGGIGWFRIRTKHAHDVWDGDPADPEAYDQELVLERLPNNLAVYDDPSANKPTRSDSLFRFIVEDMDREEFKRRWPDADLRGLEEFQSTGDMAAWVSKDTIRVAEYWRVTFEERQIWATKDGKAGEGKPPKKTPLLYTRTIRKPVVKGSLINAVEELEAFDWVGSRLPQVPILGEELNVDGKPVLRGIIAMGMDAQRMVNYTYSGAVEIFSLASKNAPRVPAESIARYKSIWDTRNIYNYSYLPYDQWDDDGKELRAPMDDNSEPPIEAAVALMRVSEEALKASTSTGDASLGNTNPNERSGRALEALQSQSELANSNYPDNVRRALIYAAELMIEVIPKITRPGQILHIMGLDDEPEQVMVGQPFTKGPDGIPQPAPVDPAVAKLKETLPKFYDLTKGRYSTTVTIGKASATRQQEGSRALGELIPHLPPDMAAVATPAYVKQLSFPGAQGIAEMLENALPPNLKPQKDDGGPGALPPEVQQQLTQLQGALQQAQQAIATDQAKQQASIQTAQLKEQGEMQREQMRIAADLEKAKMDNATRIEVARIGAAKQIADTRAEGQEERLSTGLTIAADAAAQQREQAHAATVAAMGHAANAGAQATDHAHEADTLAATQAHASAESEAAREAAREQAAMAAKQQESAGV
jgi:hypothetical protein